MLIGVELMAQPTEAQSKFIDTAEKPMLQDQQAAIVSLTDSTTGAAGDTVDDTSAGTKDDIASLAAKILEILVVLRNHGLIAD